MQKEFSLADTDTQERNLTILLEKGIIADKESDRQYFSLGHILQNPQYTKGQKFLAGVGTLVLADFVAETLGLLPPPGSWNPPGFFLGYNTALSFTQGAAIEFGLPALTARPLEVAPVLLVKAQDGRRVAERAFVLIAPVEELAQENVSVRSAGLYTRIGVRLGLKHLSAISASYGTYSLLRGEKNNNDFLAKNAAVVQYLAAAKLIGESERADLRQWTTLPKNLWMLDTAIPEGDYRLFLTDKKRPNIERPIGDFSFKKDGDGRFALLKIP